jgi:Family of unknown function (DUF6533)
MLSDTHFLDPNSLADRYVLVASFSKHISIIRSIQLIINTVLVVYDTIITLSYEVEYIWRRKFKLGTALYLVSRYLTLLYFLLVILNNFINASPEVRFVFMFVLESISHTVYKSHHVVSAII